MGSLASCLAIPRQASVSMNRTHADLAAPPG
jgi:hypothetical protein